MAQLYDSVVSGTTTEQIYEAQTKSTLLTSLYPSFMSYTTFVNNLVSTLLVTLQQILRRQWQSQTSMLHLH